MKKVKSEYVFQVQANNDTSYPDDVRVIVNEGAETHIKVEMYQDRWRSKEEFIKLYKWIIKELENLTY